MNRLGQSFTYTIACANGDLMKIRVPIAWSHLEVAKKYPHGICFLHLPRGFRMLGRGEGEIVGKAAVYVPANEDEQPAKVDRIPETDSEVNKILKAAGIKIG